MGFLNADDIFKKVLSDLYSSWREILALCGIACGLCTFWNDIKGSILMVDILQVDILQKIMKKHYIWNLTVELCIII